MYPWDAGAVTVDPRTNAYFGVVDMGDGQGTLGSGAGFDFFRGLQTAPGADAFFRPAVMAGDSSTDAFFDRYALASYLQDRGWSLRENYIAPQVVQRWVQDASGADVFERETGSVDDSTFWSAAMAALAVVTAGVASWTGAAAAAPAAAPAVAADSALVATYGASGALPSAGVPGAFVESATLAETLAAGGLTSAEAFGGFAAAFLELGTPVATVATSAADAWALRTAQALAANPWGLESLATAAVEPAARTLTLGDLLTGVQTGLRTIGTVQAVANLLDPSGPPAQQAPGGTRYSSFNNPEIAMPDVTYIDAGAVQGSLNYAANSDYLQSLNFARTLDTVNLAAGIAQDTATRGFDLARYLADLFGANTQRSTGQAFDLAGQVADSAVSSSERTTGQAFDLARNLTDSTAGRVSDLAGRLGGQAFDLAGQFADSATSSSERTTGQAFDLARNLTDSTAGRVSDLAGRLGGQAFDLAGQFADSATSSSERATGQAFDLARSMGESQTSFLSSVLSRTFNTQEQVTGLVANAYNDAKGRGAQTDNIIMLAIAGAVLVAFIALRK